MRACVLNCQPGWNCRRRHGCSAGWHVQLSQPMHHRSALAESNRPFTGFAAVRRSEIYCQLRTSDRTPPPGWVCGGRHFPSPSTTSFYTFFTSAEPPPLLLPRLPSNRSCVVGGRGDLLRFADARAAVNAKQSPVARYAVGAGQWMWDGKETKEQLAAA